MRSVDAVVLGPFFVAKVNIEMKKLLAGFQTPHTHAECCFPSHDA
jgi:hypothetical protein